MGTTHSPFHSCCFVCAACVKMDAGDPCCHWKILQNPSWMERKTGWRLSAQQKRPGGNNPVPGYLQAVHTWLQRQLEDFPPQRNSS